LIGLRDLVDRTLVEVRLTAGLSERRERILLADFIAEVQVGASIEAAGRDLEFIVAPIDNALVIEGDRQILSPRSRTSCRTPSSSPGPTGASISPPTPGAIAC
jgi:hypothetical protein